MCIVVSGCTSPESVSLSNPMVQWFIQNHPDVIFSSTYYPLETSQDIIETVRNECRNLNLQPRDFYFVNITDPQTEDWIGVWVDWENQAVVCVVTNNPKGEPQVTKPACDSHYMKTCYNGSVYWIDSCGNLEELLETCEYNCSNATCCKPEYEYDCYNGSVYWFDSCGNLMYVKEECEFGCENKTCVKKCIETDVGIDVYTKGSIFYGDLVTSDLCHVGKLIEYFCDGDELNWTLLDCPKNYTCVNGACIPINTTH